MANYQLTLLAVLFVALVASSFAGYLIAHRGLAPIAEVMATARQVRSTMLHERIETTAIPSELAARRPTAELRKRGNLWSHRPHDTTAEIHSPSVAVSGIDNRMFQQLHVVISRRERSLAALHIFTAEHDWVAKKTLTDDINHDDGLPENVSRFIPPGKLNRTGVFPHAIIKHFLIMRKNGG